MSPRVLQLGVCLVAVAVAGCATVPRPPDAQSVDQLELEGPKQLAESAIKEKIVTTESSWWPTWVPVLGHAEPFDPIAWQADLRRVTRFYEAQGYYQARILEDQVTEPAAGHVKLLVRLREGLPARLERLEIVGLEALPAEHQAQALHALPSRQGDIFLEDSWQRSKGLLAARLRQLGYAEVVVTGEALVDVDAPSVRATLEVKPGPRYRFGQIFVATDPGAQVSGKLISDQASGGVRSGDWYSESALNEAQARVLQMGVFGAVKVNRGAPEAQTGTVPVVIDVREAPFRSVRLGAGLGGDLARQDLHVVGEYTHRNFGLARLFDKAARLDRLSLKAKLGWAFLPTIFSVLGRSATSQSGAVGSLLTEYEVPRIFSVKTLSLQTALNLSRAMEAAYEYYGGEVKLGLLWRPRVDVNVLPSINFDAFFLSSELSPGTNAPTAAIGCPQRPLACLIGFFDLTVEWDRRDNKLEPREGTYAALGLQGGLSQMAHLTPYLRVLPELRGYASFGREKKLTLAGKLRAGTLIAQGNETPIIARFFSGGSGMRGFNQRRLSPMAAVPTLGANRQPVVVDTPSAPDGTSYLGTALPIGGSGLLEASVELRWNAREELSIALFSDAGQVSWGPLALTLESLRALYLAVGLGVRYQTPLGPIRFDLALRIPGIGPAQTVFQPATQPTGPAGPRDVYVPANGGCFFNLGATGDQAYAGAPENLCTWHLSIGEAF